MLAAVALNDQSAYKELFILLHGRLKQFAYSILKSNEEAEELVSDIFIRVWEKRDQLPAIESPLLYFFAAAKNLALTRLGKQKQQQSISGEDWLVQMNSIYFDPEKLLITEEMMRQVKKAINDLPPRCRLIFKLVKEDGLSYKQVAAILDISTKTVDSQLCLALKKLAAILQAIHI